MEDQARAAWKAALGTDEISDDSNFFDLGGDSAAALSVVLTLEDDYSIFVEADILFGNPRFGDFVNAVQAAVDEQKSVEL